MDSKLTESELELRLSQTIDRMRELRNELAAAEQSKMQLYSKIQCLSGEAVSLLARLHSAEARLAKFECRKCGEVGHQCQS